MRVIEDNLRKHYDRKEDVITLFLALQRQNFALGNALKKPLWKNSNYYLKMSELISRTGRVTVLDK